ncbi:FomB family phosphonate monophosphate kinase [Streptomyces sp. GbtcB6]|uniref:FomB family phosphonate monophosphate kinase n=1 Tax=Streptomyces sp. GbtcB6 TaxID=2824751 RepID=UPI001C30F2DB|nr:FomB family phosphonate monophosphate kinase [Streptomyces sp. GbtcB6]
MTSPTTAATGAGVRDDVEAALRGRYTIRSSAVVDLNLLRVRISSNLAAFAGYGFFSRFAQGLAAEEQCDYEVVCVDLDEDPIDPDLLDPLADRGFRADRFRGGFYLTHHYGPPAHLATRGNRIYVFGRRLDRTIWPYFTKHLLTIHAVDHDLVHLKAAAFVQPGFGASLLFGRGGGGKTVFLTQACAAGADFLSNTHVLTRDDIVYGVPSAMRIRRDRCFAEIIDSRQLEQHLDANEFRLDPGLIFGREPVGRATIRNLCIIDYALDRPPCFEEVDEEPFEAFLDLFAFAIGTYGLKDDVLAHLDYDFRRYGAAYADMKRRMRELVAGTRRLYVNADMLDPAVRDRTLARLAE